MKFFKIENGEESLITDKKVDFREVNDHPDKFNYEFLGHVKFMEITFQSLVKSCPYSETKVFNGTLQFLNHLWLWNYHLMKNIKQLRQSWTIRMTTFSRSSTKRISIQYIKKFS